MSDFNILPPFLSITLFFILTLDWQELNKWNLFINSLTMPQPPCPLVIHMDRNTVSLKWTSPMAPKALDETRFGFNVTFCNTATSTSSLLSDTDLLTNKSKKDDEISTVTDGITTVTSSSGSSSSSSSSESIPSCLFYQLERKDLQEELDLSSSTHTGSEVLIFSAKVKGLQPSTSYRYRLTMFYGQAYSAPSPWSLIPVTTNPLTTPSPVTTIPTAIIESVDVTSLRLVFAQPVDDGGSDILGYHIYGRHTRSSYHYSEWLWMGTSAVLLLQGQGKHVVHISNLIGNTEYQFKVTPFNIVGSSTVPSPATSTITTKNTTVASKLYSEVYGRGHPSRYSASSGLIPDHAHPKHHSAYSDSSLESSNTSTSLLLLSISDYDQKVTALKITAAASTATVEKSIATSTSTSTLSDKSLLKKLLTVEGWSSHWSPSLFTVTAEAVWTQPVLANSTLVNHEEVHGRIAVTYRGLIPLVFKALHAQMAGALGVIIIDDGTCIAFDQLCVPGADKSRGERFSAIDHSAPWRNIRIPVILLLKSAAKELLKSINLSYPLTSEFRSFHAESSSISFKNEEL